MLGSVAPVRVSAMRTGVASAVYARAPVAVFAVDAETGCIATPAVIPSSASAPVAKEAARTVNR